MIHKMMFTRYEATPGQWESLVATSWTVPDGVSSISLVTVGCALLRGATKLVNSLPGETRIGDGGGNGGGAGSAEPNYGAAGGHGGYSGNGGKGGNISTGEGNPESGQAGGAGSGGGGGGGGGGGRAWNYGGGPSGSPSTGGRGGGVGLSGIGSNGSGGGPGEGGDGWSSPGANGGAGSALPGATVVLGNWNGVGNYSVPGSNLSWSNDIAVTPGEVLTIQRPAPGSGYNSGIRILWGGGRSYPSNAGSV